MGKDCPAALTRPLCRLLRDEAPAVQQALLPNLAACLGFWAQREADARRDGSSGELAKALLELEAGTKRNWRMQEQLAAAFHTFPGVSGPSGRRGARRRRQPRCMRVGLEASWMALARASLRHSLGVGEGAQGRTDCHTRGGLTASTLRLCGCAAWRRCSRATRSTSTSCPSQCDTSPTRLCPCGPWRPRASCASCAPPGAARAAPAPRPAPRVAACASACSLQAPRHVPRVGNAAHTAAARACGFCYPALRSSALARSHASLWPGGRSTALTCCFASSATFATAAPSRPG